MKRLATMLACSQLICFILLSYGSGFSAGLWPSAHGLNWWRGRWRERVHTSTSYRINSWLYRLFVWFAHYVMTWLNGCSSSLSTHVRESSEHLCLHCCRCFCKHAKMSQFSTQAGCNTTWHKRHDLNRMCIPWSMAGKWRWSGCSDQCLWTGSRMATDVADGCDQEEFVGACQVSRALQLTSSDRNSEKRTTIGKNTKKTSCLSKAVVETWVTEGRHWDWFYLNNLENLEQLEKAANADELKRLAILLRLSWTLPLGHRDGTWWLCLCFQITPAAAANHSWVCQSHSLLLKDWTTLHWHWHIWHVLGGIGIDCCVNFEIWVFGCWGPPFASR